MDLFGGCCAASCGEGESIDLIEHAECTDPSLDACMDKLKEVVVAMSDAQQRQDDATRVLKFLVNVLDHRVSLDGGCKKPPVLPQRRSSRNSMLTPRDKRPPADAPEDMRPPADAPEETHAGNGFHDEANPDVPLEAMYVDNGVCEEAHAGVPLEDHKPRECKPSQSWALSPFESVKKSGKSSDGNTLAQQRMQKLMKEADPTRATAREVRTFREVGFCTWLQTSADRILRWRRFEYMMGVAILLNSICIGIETQQGLVGTPWPALATFEVVFLVIYSIELIIRILARGRRAFQDSWFIFDFVLVMSGIGTTFIFEPMQKSGQNFGLFSQLMVFRTCRLLRLLRALRMIQQFRSIWRLVYGLLTSFNTMVSTLSLVALVLYIFACLGIELITKDEDLNDPQFPELNSIVDKNFKDLFVTLLFLFQFVTLDSVASVYVPLVKQKPVLALYFLSVLLVVSISLMNLVMAKIVEGALDAAHRDDELEREQRKEKIRSIVPLLSDLFERLDQDGSGMVELTELETLDAGSIPEELTNLIQLDSMRELFDMLDVDRSGEVSQEEFIEGVLQMHISELPIQQVHMLKLVRVLRDKADNMEARMDAMGEIMGITKLPAGQTACEDGDIIPTGAEGAPRRSTVIRNSRISSPRPSLFGRRIPNMERPRVSLT